MSSRSNRRLASGGLSSLLAIWLVAEVLAFALVVHLAGVGGALLIGLATSAAGGLLLRRLGRSAAAQLRAAARSVGVQVGTGLSDGLLQALAALLLILPGFLSDVLGAALAAAPVRQAALAYVARRGRAGRGAPVRRDPGIVDLPPQDWRRVDGR